MKKITQVFFAIIVLLWSCKPGKEKLQLNLEKGQSYTVTISSKASVSQTLNSQQVNMDMGIVGKMAYKVTEIRDSVYDMEVTYQSLSMRMDLPNGVMEFSSEKNDEYDLFSRFLSMIKNKPFLVVMSKSGKIIEVKNIETLFSGLFDQFPQLNDAQQQQVKDQLMQAYGEKAFKGNLEMVTAVFAGIPVSKGDKWIIKTQLESGMSANMETTYELKEIDDNSIEISGNANIETADKDAYIQANGMPLRYDLKGTMISGLKLNRKTGWIVEAKINQDISGSAHIKDNPQIPGGMTIPMHMKNEMTMTEK
jgi:hypothetical protein